MKAYNKNRASLGNTLLPEESDRRRFPLGKEKGRTAATVFGPESIHLSDR